jgi:hypothetical protein
MQVDLLEGLVKSRVHHVRQTQKLTTGIENQYQDDQTLATAISK